MPRLARWPRPARLTCRAANGLQSDPECNEVLRVVSSPGIIYLTGFMGSGKSTVGPALSRVLGIPYVDLDAEIVRLAGHSIPEIFRKDGEPAFRRYEHEALKAAAAGGVAVVSVGGGALADSENLRLALETGAVVYLQATPEALAVRLSGGRRNRPMLQDAAGNMLSGSTLRHRIEQLLVDRTPYYEQAHVRVDTSRRSVREVVDEVVARLGLDAHAARPGIADKR